MALLSRAACDIASKTVTGSSANTLFMEMEVMARSAAGLRRQTRGLPGNDAARKVLVVRQAGGLRRKRRGDRPFSRAAGKHHLLAAGIRNVPGVESRKRDHDRVRIGL